MTTNHFDQAASGWDNEPKRVALMRGIGEKIVERAELSREMDVLDYGCGTGLISLFLLPHVQAVTGADNSPGMLEVLERKIAESDLQNMTAIHLDLEKDSVPEVRYDRITVGMAMHHIANTDRVLRAFYRMLTPGGMLCLADLDTEPGTFHAPEVADGVYHHGFDRESLKSQLAELGFVNSDDTTVVTFKRPVSTGGEGEFSIFLVTAKKSNEDTECEAS